MSRAKLCTDVFIEIGPSDFLHQTYHKIWHNFIEMGAWLWNDYTIISRHFDYLYTYTNITICDHLQLTFKHLGTFFFKI